MKVSDLILRLRDAVLFDKSILDKELAFFDETGWPCSDFKLQTGTKLVNKDILYVTGADCDSRTHSPAERHHSVGRILSAATETKDVAR